MKRLLVMLALALSLAGCANQALYQGPDPTVDQTDKVAVAVAAAQDVIDEAQADRTAVNRTIRDRVHNKLWTATQGQKYLDLSKTYAKRIKQAQTYLDQGKVLDANGEAAAVKLLIHQLAIEVAKQAAKDRT